MSLIGADTMENHNGVVIVGGSIAGYNVARTLRKDGYLDKITMIDQKTVLPYDRSKLSKEWMLDREKEEAPLFQKEAFFSDSKITVKLNTTVTDLFPDEKAILTDKKEKIYYDTLVLATGSVLRTLDVPGADAHGIFYLRDYENALKIKEWSKNVKDLAIIGAGFIGLEMASTFSQLGLNVTVIEYEKYPLGRILGEAASRYFINMHEAHGMRLLTGEGLKEFKKDEAGNVTTAVTTSGQEVPCQMAVIGVGVIPNPSLQHPDLKAERGIIVNEYGETSLPDVYAVGDCAIWPYQEEAIHVEHWEHAHDHGQAVAKNILKAKSHPYTIRPYFWTDQYDQTFEYLGHALRWDKIITRGSLDDREFTLAYVDKNNHPLAIFFANNGDTRKEVTEFMDKNQTINEEKFKDMNLPL